MVTAHPSFNQLQMRRVRDRICNRHLVRPPGALQPLAVELLRASPSFGSAHYDHRPSRTNRIGGVTLSRLLLDLANFHNTSFKRCRHQLMDRLRLVSRYHVRLVAIPTEQAFEFVVRNAREDRRVGNLVAVEMENRQYRSVTHRVQEFIGMPRGCERSRFRLAITNYCDGNQTGIVESSAVRMGEAVAKFSSFVD